MSDTVQQIKDKLSILDVVQQYVKLTRAGKHYKGLSPFTKEKTPSFFVAPDRGLYHCFSTGKGGDMFTFIEEMEGVDFRGALKILADKAGVELVAQNPGERDARERVYVALAGAQEFFVTELAKKPDALVYLEGRGLKKENIAEWGIGYAPKEWQALRDALLAKGFTDDELQRAGLVKKAEEENSPGRLYDRFRGRIMFPIRDISGRVVGFSGRIFEDDAKNPQAKYLNSPETDVFDKSRVLYGLSQAREGIRSLGATILVEGQLDLLLSHQAGYKNAVATSGTAFTDKHAELLKRYTPNLLISYDGDRAGITAAGRAAAIALRAGLNVKVAKLPPGKDPADLLKESPILFKEAIKGALHVVDFYLAHIADAKYDARTFRLEVSRVVLPYVAMIGNAIDKAHFVKRVAEVLQVPEEAVMAEVAKAHNAQRTTHNAEPDQPGASRSTLYAVRSEPFLSRRDTIERLLSGLGAIFAERGETELAQKAGYSDAQQKSMPEDARRAALFEADLFLERNADTESLPEILEELLSAIQKESRHEHYRDTLSALRVAEIAHDSARAEELMRELQALAPNLK